MKKLKLLIVLLFVFILTGCTGKYNLEIKNDLSVEEKLTLEVSNVDLEKTINIFKENKINKDNYSVQKKSESVVIRYNEKYNTFDDYILKSKVYHQLVDNIQYNKTKKYIDLYVDEKLKLNTSELNIGNVNDIENLDITVDLPFKVLTSNADNVDKTKYTWNISNANINQKMFIVFSPNNSSIISIQLILGVVLVICSIILGIIIVRSHKERQKI